MNTAILVPFYLPQISLDARLALQALARWLPAAPRFLLAPSGLELPLSWPAVHFPPEYFTSVAAYSRLLLSPAFYQAFAAYDYILIYQLDCFVFSDRLAEFCALGHDYIGAPLFKSDTDPTLGFSRVGNGGFSLRKVSSFLRVLTSPHIPPWTKLFTHPFPDLAVQRSPRPPDRAPGGKSLFPSPVQGEGSGVGVSSPFPERREGRGVGLSHRFRILRAARRGVRWYTQNYTLNEDLFWSDRARLFDPGFDIAPIPTALRFAFERFPRYCYEQNHHQLPFGAHAWPKHDRQFWEPFLNPKS